MVFLSRRCASGKPITQLEWLRYADDWDRLGIGPEAYPLLHQIAPKIAQTVRREFGERAEARLAELQLDGDLGYAGTRNLDPKQWAALPELALRMRFWLAIRAIIVSGIEEDPEDR